MPIFLTHNEARVLGCLIEKSLTTPELYPLTLNSLVNACNQKSSRDPVMNLDEATVARELATLQQKELASPRSESGNRVPKFRHHIENLLKGGSSKEVGIMCVLFLRGAQTPGEIKTRTERLCEFESTAEVEMILNELAAHTEGPFVVRLARQTGQKEARFMHTLCGDAPKESAPAEAPRPTISLPPKVDRVAELEKRLQQLEERIQKLEDKWTPQ